MWMVTVYSGLTTFMAVSFLSRLRFGWSDRFCLSRLASPGVTWIGVISLLALIVRQIIGIHPGGRTLPDDLSPAVRTRTGQSGLVAVVKISKHFGAVARVLSDVKRLRGRHPGCYHGFLGCCNNCCRS